MEALRRFLKNSDVTVRQVKEAAPVSEVLGEIGSRQEIIRTMRFSQNEEVVKFLRVYDALPAFDRDRAGIPLEAIILRAGIDPNTLLGATVVAYRIVQAQKSSLKIMSAHPTVVKDSIFFSRLPDGYKDRQMLHQAVGFVPTPKGSNINVNFPGQPSQTEKPAEVVTIAEDAPDPVDVFPRIDERQDSWQQNRQKALAEKND